MTCKTFRRFFGLLCLFSTHCFGEVSSSNIASFNPNAEHVIRFCMARSQTNGALKSSLLYQLKTVFKVQAFVESGTYLGYTTSEAAKFFEKVHTIELSEELYTQAQSKFKGSKNVVVHLGNSGEVLCDLLPSISSRLLFYLDGHYSGGATAQGSLNTPILDELAAIEKAGKSDSVILIDDIRLFQASLYPKKIQNTCLVGYPSLAQLVGALLEINPRYQICFLGDALLAFPEDPQVSVSSIMNACALHVLSSSCIDVPEKVLRNADQFIARARADEYNEIVAYYQTYAPSDFEYGLPSFATLWFGLILRQKGRTSEALSLFQQAAQNSLPGWRVTQICADY